MPQSIAVAAFMFGLMCIGAAFLGTEITVKEIKIPRFSLFKRMLLGGFGAALVLIGLNDGRLPVPATAAVQPATAPPAGGSAALAPVDSAALANARPLPNAARARVASVKVEYGCVLLYGAVGSAADALRVCQDTPDVPAEWQTKVARIGPDCAASPRGPIVWVYAARDYASLTWEYSFGC